MSDFTPLPQEPVVSKSTGTKKEKIQNGVFEVILFLDDIFNPQAVTQEVLVERDVANVSTLVVFQIKQCTICRSSNVIPQVACYPSG
ncbi:hypothetical protein EVAR_99330_1 [Eumeta japonica]|uniref:Uncharacterized protein n=1 Tax=Eumeta variegata TaxID=151549 RepID=A0A4C1ZID1_EUMVA|nr:hypothetical protein EVAR_99330_1 [Eumeta japonica]